jgi:hypothetical protein
MHKNTIIKALFFILISLALNLNALAQPTIEWADYYTDCYYNNPFGPDGCHEVVCAYVESDIVPVFVQVIDETPGHYKSINLDPEGNWYCRFVENDGFVANSLLILAWYQVPYSPGFESSEKYTNTLDNIIWMDEADNISISDFSTSPLVSWNSDPDTTRYYLRVLDSLNNEIHRSPPLDLPEYKIPNDVLTTYQHYYFRLLKQNYDDCSVYSWGQCLENRSSTWIGFTPLHDGYMGPPTIEDIQDFFQGVVDVGLLQGEDGPFWDADWALNRMGHLLENASWHIENERHIMACSTLRRALRRCAGEGNQWWNQDYVSGVAQEQLAAMIEELMIELGCQIF